MESTGVYWKPVFNVLEGRFEVLLVNAQHIKQVPGRKTDVKDCEWIAQLLQHGLLRASFIPPRPIRELRDLTRQRAQLVAERRRWPTASRRCWRTPTSSWLAWPRDVLGVSGRAMLRGPDRRAGRPGGGWPSWRRGGCGRRSRSCGWPCAGRVTEHHRFLLRLLLDHYTVADPVLPAVQYDGWCSL